MTASDTSRNIFSKGAQYMFWATFCFAAMFFFIRELKSYHVFEIVFFRSAITSLFCMLYLKRHQVSFIGKRQKYLLWRAIVGIVSMTLFFVTLQRIPMGASVSLKYLSPVFTAIFAVFLLKERVKNIQWLFFLGALLGVFLLKGFDSRIDNFSLILALISAALGGMVYVLIRRIGPSEHPMVIINYFMLLASVLAGIAMIPYWQTPIGRDAWLFLGMGTVGYFGQVLMTRSLQQEMASKVAPIKYMEVIHSILIGYLWFGEIIPWQSLLGIALIIGCMLLNLRVKQR